MSTHIEPTAAVDPRAELDDEVHIGPFCVVGPKVRIGRGTNLLNNITIMGRVTLGEHNRIFAGAVLGGDPQDISYRGSDTELIVGNGNVIREGVTINRATEKEDGVTTLGDNSFIMAGSFMGSASGPSTWNTYWNRASVECTSLRYHRSLCASGINGLRMLGPGKPPIIVTRIVLFVARQTNVMRRCLG